VPLWRLDAHAFGPVLPRFARDSFCLRVILSILVSLFLVFYFASRPSGIVQRYDGITVPLSPLRQYQARIFGKYGIAIPKAKQITQG